MRVETKHTAKHSFVPQARLYSLQADPATYCNEPDGKTVKYECWIGISYIAFEAFFCHVSACARWMFTM